MSKNCELLYERKLFLNLDQKSDEEVSTDEEYEEFSPKSNQLSTNIKCEEMEINIDKCLNSCAKRVVEENSDSDDSIKIIDVKLFESNVSKSEVQSPTTSEAPEVSITKTDDQSSDVSTQSSGHKKNKSIKSRFMTRHFDCRLIDRTTGLRECDKSAIDLSSDRLIENKSILVIKCLICTKKIKSKKNFIKHYQKRHSDLPVVYVKYRKIIDKEIKKQLKSSLQKSSNCEILDQKTDSLNIKLKTTSTKPSKSSSNMSSIENLKNVEKTKNICAAKVKNKVKTKSTTADNSVAVSNVYRIVPQCQICSFVPLINSMASIEDHITREHNQMLGSEKDFEKYYKSIMIKVKTKATPNGTVG